ncbi:MAG TPA: ATP-grasp domain-containing protein [Tenuifilaceae bacterium]|nr:ATP-grasp domain-containing protein [Tenuifilaceae bacterium]HRX32172.1 ATP-grasp domain-containing protein [Tenuifilaceae bacterium]
MVIGLTYDLKSTYLKNGFSQEEVAEFDSESTIEGIEKALHELGFETERIGNVYELVSAISNGKKWDLVFNIAEGLYGVGREAQVPAILDAYKIPYIFSDPLVLSLTLHKGLTKHVIRDNGIPTAPFVTINTISEVENVELNYPLFVKPAAEGTGKGITNKSLVRSKAELLAIVSELLQKFNQPVLVEEFLPGREFTVGIVGTGSTSYPVGIMEISITDKSADTIYSMFVKENYVNRVEYTVPEDTVTQQCYKVALDAWRVLGCKDAGRVDLRMDKNGVPNFIEVNPLAGLNYVYSDLPILAYKAGYSYTQLISEIVTSALKRLKLNTVTNE